MNDNSQAVALLLERLARVLHNVSQAADLKPTQWEALRYFARANDVSSTPSALTAYLGVTKGTVSQTINALERKGLIAKHEVSGDRRAVRVSPTTAGRRLLRQDPLTLIGAAVDALSVGEQKALERGLGALLEAMLVSRDHAPFGVCRTCRHFAREADGSARCALLEVALKPRDEALICVEHAPAAADGPG